MKASEVLSKLGVSRVTLMNYVKKGKLVVIKKENMLTSTSLWSVLKFTITLYFKSFLNIRL
jgi:hypothetical protein